MAELEDKLQNILNNPQMMQQIMSMAQAMGSSTAPSEPSGTHNDATPDIDLGLLQKISSLAGQSHIDSNQQSLLQALEPYLSRERIHKLEKAMRAAKIARMASHVIGSGALQFPSGR